MCGVALFCLARAARVSGDQLAAMARVNLRAGSLVIESVGRAMQLAEVDYIDRALRKYGLSGYLSTATDRLRNDVEQIQEFLGLDYERAVEYLKSGLAPSGNEHRSQSGSNGRSSVHDLSSADGESDRRTSTE